MKKIVVISFLLISFISLAYSQNIAQVDGGDFVKKVEYNLIAKGWKEFKGTKFHDSYNIRGKSDIEKLFFGDFNAPVEFLYSPSFEASVKGDAGFRMVKDSLNISYALEIKFIPNYEEVFRRINAKRDLIDVPARLLDSLPRDIFNLIWDYNRDYQKRNFEELPKHFMVETLSFPISDQFAEKLYEKMVSFIDGFKAKGIPSTILDGYSVTFRTVVDDEVWSLWVHMPQGDALKMADLCKQIITDAKAEKLNEQKYTAILNTFEEVEVTKNWN